MKNLKEFLVFCLSTALSLSLLAACGKPQTPMAGAETPAEPSSAASEGSLRVMASFYPMYDFAQKIGGDKVTVTNMVPAGTEPHDWEPSPSDIVALEQADVFVYSGAVRLLGQDTARFRNWRRLGYVPQDGLARHTDFPASVEEVVLANLSGEIGLLRFPRQEHRERVRQALELVGMAGYGRRLIGALSGGQRQRVLLARALISRPEVMLLDEPTSGMDLQSGENFYRLLAGLNRDHGLTILMVGHDVDRVCSYVSTLYCLEEGTLAELTPGQVRRERAGLHRHSDMTRERRGERSVHL